MQTQERTSKVSDNAFDRVSYNKKDIERDAAQETLADGAIVKIVVDKVDYKLAPTKGKGPGEDMVQLLHCSVVDPSDGQTRLKRHRLFVRNILPITNPEYADTHVPPEYSNGLWSQTCQAFIPERHKATPERKDGQVFFDGKKVEPTQVAAIEMERSDKRLQEAVESAKARGKDWLRRTAYATIKVSPNEQGGFWVNANSLRAALRNDEKLTDKKNLTVKMLPGQNVDGSEKKATNGVAAEEAPKKSSRRSRS